LETLESDTTSDEGNTVDVPTLVFGFKPKSPFQKHCMGSYISMITEFTCRTEDFSFFFSFDE